MISYTPDPDPYVFPPLIEALENTRHIFHVHLARGSRRGFPRFILDSVEDVPLPALPAIPPHTEEGGPSATAESPNVTPITEESPTETPTTREIGSGSLTPPPAPQSDEPTEPVTATSELQSTGVRRQLFQETEEKSPTRAAKKAKVD